MATKAIKDAGLIAYLLDQGLEPNADTPFVEVGTDDGRSLTAMVFDNTSDLRRLTGAYHSTTCCCREHLRQYREVLRFLQDGAPGRIQKGDQDGGLRIIRTDRDDRDGDDWRGRSRERRAYPRAR